MTGPARQDPPRRAGIARLVAGNLVALAVLLLMLCLAEIYFRHFYDSTDSFGLTLVSKRWFERHYRFNEFPSRDNIEYSLEKAPGRSRITFLGDSFTAGHGVDVDSRFVNILRKRSADGPEIHAIAANGLDTGAQIFLLHDSFQRGYQTDVIVLVYVLNDISDLVPEVQAAVERIYEVQRNEGFLVRNSYFINYLFYRFRTAHDPVRSDYFTLLRDAYAGPIWFQQKGRLREISKLCSSLRLRLLVVTFPFLHALGPEYSFAEAHEKLGAFWEEVGVPNLDLLSVYEPYRPDQLVIGKSDSHPNEFAHELAAAAIDAFLEQELK